MKYLCFQYSLLILYEKISRLNYTPHNLSSVQRLETAMQSPCTAPILSPATENNTYRIHDPTEIKLLNSLWLGFSHLREHKCRLYFVEIMNPVFACALETECTAHFFLRCHNYSHYERLLWTERVTWYW